VTAADGAPLLPSGARTGVLTATAAVTVASLSHELRAAVRDALLLDTTAGGDGGGGVGFQVHAIATALAIEARRAGAALADAVFVHMYLRDMAAFAAANAAYCCYWGAHPPSRSAVALRDLPPGVDVALDALFLPGSWGPLAAGGDTTARDTLHVASLSHWAPLCIGPYCQANVCGSGAALFLAGQIPLDPGTMTLAHGDDAVPGGVHLSLRHVHRILQPLRSSAAHLASLTLYAPTLPAAHGALAAARAWLDSPPPDSEYDDSSTAAHRGAADLPLAALVVSALPRGAPVEVEAISVGANPDAYTLPWALLRGNWLVVESAAAALPLPYPGDGALVSIRAYYFATNAAAAALLAEVTATAARMRVPVVPVPVTAAALLLPPAACVDVPPTALLLHLLSTRAAGDMLA